MSTVFHSNLGRDRSCRHPRLSLHLDILFPPLAISPISTLASASLATLTPTPAPVLPTTPSTCTPSALILRWRPYERIVDIDSLFEELGAVESFDGSSSLHLCRVLDQNISLCARCQLQAQGRLLHGKGKTRPTLTYPVLRSRFKCIFLMSPCSANRSLRSSSEVSSWMLVATTIHPSIERTATAFCAVRASAAVDGFFASGEGEPLGWSTSISCSIVDNRVGL